MASLLNQTTSAQLGIGASAQNFATGVKTKKKKGAADKLTLEQAQMNKQANEAGDARLKQQQQVNVSYDAKTDGANLMLNTNDKAFIEAVKDMESRLFSNQYKGAGGAKGEMANFLALADQSSRGGLGDVWNDTIAALSKGEVSGKKLALLQEEFTKAYDKTSSVLNLDVDLGRYKFDDAATQAVVTGKDIKGEKGERTKETKQAYQEAKKATKTRAKENLGVSSSSNPTFAWDAAASLAIRP